MNEKVSSYALAPTTFLSEGYSLLFRQVRDMIATMSIHEIITMIKEREARVGAKYPQVEIYILLKVSFKNTTRSL